jgi:glutaredoxin-like protein NrdH
VDVKHVSGKNAGKVFLYALSTCGWCKKTKGFLNDSGLEYSYVDVDLVPPAESDQVIGEVKRWNPACSFPTIVINDEVCIVGFQPDKIREALKV